MQKFNKGDLVRIAKDLGSSMSHFRSDCDAVVIGSYSDKYGGDNTESYTLHLHGSGKASWYYEEQLTLIESGRLDILAVWQKERDDEASQKGDIDYIFENGNDVLESAHGAAISTLAKCIGIDNLWGSNGEGFVYYQNALLVLGLAQQFLERNDKDGWLSFCDEHLKVKSKL